MSDETTGTAHANARVSTMPKLSMPIDGATSTFVLNSSAVRSSWLRKPSTSMPVSGDTVAREQQANGQRVGADDAKPRARAAVDLGPGVEQHRQALARVVTADEDDRVLPVRRVRRGRHEHAVRDDVVRAGKPARDRRPRLVGDRDAVVDAIDEEAPERQAHAMPVELSRRMPRRHSRTSRGRERRRRRFPASSARGGEGRRSAPSRAHVEYDASRAA